MNKFEALKQLISSLTPPEKKIVSSLISHKTSSYFLLYQKLIKTKNLSKQELQDAYNDSKKLENDIDYLEKIIFKVLRWYYEDQEFLDDKHHLKASLYFKNIEIARIKKLNTAVEKNVKQLKQHANKYEMPFWKAMANSYEFYLLGVHQEKNIKKYEAIVIEIEKDTESFINARKLSVLSYELNNEVNVYQYQKNKNYDKYKNYLLLPLLENGKKFPLIQEQNMYHSCRANLFLLLEQHQKCIHEAQEKLQLFKNPELYKSTAHVLAYYQYVSYRLMNILDNDELLEEIEHIKELKSSKNNPHFIESLYLTLIAQYYLLTNKVQLLLDTLKDATPIENLKDQISIYKAIALFRSRHYKLALKELNNLESKDLKINYYCYFLELLCFLQLEDNEDLVLSKIQSIQRKLKQEDLYYDAFLPLIQFAKTITKPNFPTEDSKEKFINYSIEFKLKPIELLYREFDLIEWVRKFKTITN